MEMTINKNMILNFISDLSGQGQIRNVWPFTAINQIYGPQQKLVNNWFHIFPGDERLLNMAKTLYFQRQMTQSQLAAVDFYKQNQSKYGYKMTWDMDDLIWGYNELQGGTKEQGIPSYNFSHTKITKAEKEASVEIMNRMDVLLFSTNYLAKYVKEQLGVKVPSVVIPNTVPWAYWGNEDPMLRTDDIRKPRVIYTGSPTHYSNEMKLKGDWDNAWFDWVVKSVNENKIDFICMGGLPWFFESIKTKITIIDWTPLFNLHLVIKKQKADFCINPLVRNDFNRCKSDLKLVESSAAEIACVGTVFNDGTDSPYDHCFIQAKEDITVEEIDTLIGEYCNKDKFNEVLTKQRKFMVEEGRYTESPIAINRMLKAIL
jgi:hypothetical protein